MKKQQKTPKKTSGERMISTSYDPLGSYTGNTETWGEVPEQDADDL